MHVRCSPLAYFAIHLILSYYLQMAATPPNKRRKVDLEHRAFKASWTLQYFFEERRGKAQCLICMATVAVMKESNIRRHFETIHQRSKYAAMDEAGRQSAVAKLSSHLSKQSTAFALPKPGSTITERATRASFEVSLLIAKNMKPFTDGDFVKDCLLATADAMCPEQRSTFANVCLSARTVVRRIDEMSTDVRASYKKQCDAFEVFSVAIDESTDVKDTSQLAIFIRGVTEDFTVSEEFLTLVPLKGTTTGKDVSDAVLDTLTTAGLCRKRLVAVTTDGAPAMVGEVKGAASLIVKRCIEDGNTHQPMKLHCIIHQEALCAKAASLSDVMGVVVKAVNSILSRSLNHRQFQALLDEAEAAYGDLLYFCEVRWLSRGRMLARVWDLRSEIADFLEQKRLPFAAEFRDPVWLGQLAFLADITQELNVLNVRLQGKDLLVTDMFAAVKAFEVKLRLWESQIGKKRCPTFARLSSLPTTQVKWREAKEVIAGLRDQFSTRFQSLKEYAPGFSLLSSPFALCVDDLPDDLQMEVIDLQCDDELRGRFQNTSPLDFYSRFLPRERFPVIAARVRRIVAVFGSTYICEQLFSKMKYAKNRLRTNLTDENLNNILLLASTSVAPDLTLLCGNRQHQPSH